MSISVTKQAMFWGIAGLILLVFLTVFKAVLTPFVLGVVIAYLLNPLVKRFSTKGIKRTTGSALILFIFFLLITIIILLVSPLLIHEAGQLVKALPEYTDKLLTMIQPHMTWVQENLGENYADDAKLFLKDNLAKIISLSGGISGGLAGGLMAGGQAAFNMLITIALTPLVAFYMMREWPVMTHWVEDLIPRQQETMIKDIITQIDKKLSGFIRGQMTVAFLLGLIYSVALSIAGLNFGFLIGIGAGVLSIIPMVGSTVGLLVGVSVAWLQSHDWQYTAIIAAIFLVGQAVEGNLISPKLLGDSVGLHPLWIIFALMAGGSLFGILGMLIAVPVAAVIGVLVSFALGQYKNSPLYQATKDKKQKSEKTE